MSSSNDEDLLPELKLSPAMLIDKTVVLYGETNTGKTVFVKDIMFQLQKYIEQVIIVAPTEPSNRSYAGFVDSVLIHYSLSLPDPKDKRDTMAKQRMRFLENIWKRQELMASIYTRVNQVNVLASLYKRLTHAERRESDKHLATLEIKRVRVTKNLKHKIENVAFQEQQIREVNEKFEKMLILIYKKFLSVHLTRLWLRTDITPDERFALQYLHFNPRLLLIFDDCAAELKSMVKSEVFRKLFYQNRHSYITVVICCQDGTDLPPNLRKNAFISVFTTAQVCRQYFIRDRYPKHIIDYINGVCDRVYINFQKMAYIREDDNKKNYYRITANLPSVFKFGSSALQELCDKVGAKETNMDKENPFYDKFGL